MAILTINEKTFSYNCDFCSKHTEKPIEFHRAAKLRNQTLFFCSQKCHHQFRHKKQNINCGWCGKEFQKIPAEMKKSNSGKHFCCRSCAGFYNGSQETPQEELPTGLFQICTKCKKELPEIDFHKRGEKRNTKCKSCERETLQEYYQKNKYKLIIHARKWNIKQRKKLREIIAQIKSVPCADCGKSYPPHIMEFDHLPGQHKKFNVADMISKHPSIENLKKEIEKCEIVCSNCHADRTYKRRIAAQAKKSL